MLRYFADETMFPKQNPKKSESKINRSKDSVNFGLNTICRNKDLNFLMSQIIRAGKANGLISTKR